MKIAIRENVFETNSSSTHSLSFSNNTPKEFAFECDSPWSRLLMLKALINEAESQLDVEEDTTTDTEDKEPSILDEFDFEITDQDYKLQVLDLFNNCLQLFSKNQNIKLEDIPSYLGNKLLSSSRYEDINYSKEEFFKIYNQAYQDIGDHLCSFIFYNGCLNICDCNFETYCSLASKLINSKLSIAENAQNYLYGDKRFVAKECYAGCSQIKAKTKY